MGQSSKKQEINLLIPDISKMINWSKLFLYLVQINLLVNKVLVEGVMLIVMVILYGLLMLTYKSIIMYTIYFISSLKTYFLYYVLYQL